MFFREICECRPYRLIGGNAAGDDERRGIGLAQCERGPVDKAVDDGLLKAGRNILARMFAGDDGALNCAFQSRERKMGLAGTEKRARKWNSRPRRLSNCGWY